MVRSPSRELASAAPCARVGGHQEEFGPHQPDLEEEAGAGSRTRSIYLSGLCWCQNFQALHLLTQQSGAVRAGARGWCCSWKKRTYSAGIRAEEPGPGLLPSLLNRAWPLSTPKPHPGPGCPRTPRRVQHPAAAPSGAPVPRHGLLGTSSACSRNYRGVEGGKREGNPQRLSPILPAPVLVPALRPTARGAPLSPAHLTPLSARLISLFIAPKLSEGS